MLRSLNVLPVSVAVLCFRYLSHTCRDTSVVNGEILYFFYFSHKKRNCSFSLVYLVQGLVSYFFYLSRKRRDVYIVSCNTHLSPYLREKTITPLCKVTQIGLRTNRYF